MVSSWDHAAKTVASSKHPFLAGYCGNSIFGTTTLLQLISLIDAGDEPQSIVEMIEVARQIIHSSYSAYPKPASAEFVFATRQPPGDFLFFHITCRPKSGVSFKPVVADRWTGLVGSYGSGKDAYQKKYEQWQQSDDAGLSRAIASAFFDAVDSGEDRKTGGPPQIVALTKKGAGIVHGIAHNGGRFISGMRVTVEALDHISVPVEWRNSNFERCDPVTALRLPGAQRQPRPKGLVG